MPASVSDTRRVVRCNRRAPTSRSRSATKRVTVAGDMSNARAAAAKPPSSATVWNTRIVSSLSMSNHPDHARLQWADYFSFTNQSLQEHRFFQVLSLYTVHLMGGNAALAAAAHGPRNRQRPEHRETPPAKEGTHHEQDPDRHRDGPGLHRRRTCRLFDAMGRGQLPQRQHAMAAEHDHPRGSESRTEGRARQRHP